MDTYLQITSVWGVYLAGIVFIAGMAWRIWEWRTTPKSPIPLGMFPKPKTGVGRFGKRPGRQSGRGLQHEIPVPRHRRLVFEDDEPRHAYCPPTIVVRASARIGCRTERLVTSALTIAPALFDRVIMALLQRVANDPARPTWNADSFFKRFATAK